MGYQRDRLGSSGVFKLIVDASRKIKRALTDEDAELSPAAEELANLIAQAFVAGRFADIYELGTKHLQQATVRERFVSSWTDAAQDHRPLTGFRISDLGAIDLAFIPTLEEAPQSQFVAFVEIAFSGVDVPYDSERAFTVGAVLLDQNGETRIGALHAR
jgi:hypothetical protein